MSLPLTQFAPSESAAVTALGCPRGSDSSRDVVCRRVLHVINGEHYSGAERVQDLLAARLPAEGFQVGFACLKQGKFASARQFTAAPLHLLAMSSKLDFRVVQKLARIVHEDQYVALHAHTPRSVLIGRAAAALARVPLIYHVHSPTVRDSTHRLKNLFNHWTERVSLSGVRALIPVSESLKQYLLAKGYSESIIFPVANGVPAARIQRDATPPGAEWTIGTAALFRPRKGIEVLLQSLALLRAQGFPVRLRAVGPFETATYQDQVHRKVAELGLQQAIDWTGFTTDINRELAQMDVFVLPSLFGEGLPMVVLEAMAAGVPVVGTRLEGVPQVIQEGVSGLLAEPDNPEDLARCIARLVNGEVDWLKMRESAIQRHATHFSDHCMAARVADVYRRVLGGS